MTEDDIRGLLRSMRDDPVPPDSLVRVRLAVDRRRNVRSRFPWFVALGAAAALAVLFVMLRPAAQAPAPVAKIAPAPSLAPPRVEVSEVKLVRPAKVAGVTRRKARPAAHVGAPEPMVVRIETDDPDVVILLVGD